MFLIDPFLLIFFGFLSYLIGHYLKPYLKFNIGKPLVYFSLLIMIFASVSLYLNNPIMDWMWLPSYPLATSGRDFMINSFIFHFESTYTTGLIDGIAALLIAIYPIWITLGVWIFKRWKKSE